MPNVVGHKSGDGSNFRQGCWIRSRTVTCDGHVFIFRHMNSAFVNSWFSEQIYWDLKDIGQSFAGDPSVREKI